MKILALTTSHNRRESTVRALETLIRQILPPHCEMDICLVDDGCTDGTAEAVRQVVPTAIVLRGSGNLFWAGGMRFAWDTYVGRQVFDYLLVFNDDIRLCDGALAVLLKTAAELEQQACRAYAVCGALRESGSDTVAYGAVVKSSRWHPLRFRKLPPNDHIQECDTMNMNFALISKAALARIGFLAPDFVHAKADYDFGLRLRAQGGRVVLAPGYMGQCDTNPVSRSSRADNLSFFERWRRLTSIKEQSPRERAIYYRRHAGLFWPIWWAGTYVRLLVESTATGLIGRDGERKPSDEHR